MNKTPWRFSIHHSAERRSACAAITAMTLMFCGCQSSVRQASRTANTIRDIARSSEQRFGVIERQITSPHPDSATVTAEAVAGAFEQRQIQTLVGGIQETLTATQDRASPWIGVLNLWGWIAIIGAGVVALAYFGIAPILKRLLVSAAG